MSETFDGSDRVLKIGENFILKIKIYFLTLAQKMIGKKF